MTLPNKLKAFSSRVATLADARAGASSRVRGAILYLTVLCALAGLPATWAQSNAAGCSRQVTPLDAGWRFHLGDAPGSEQPEADETRGWETVNLPHDWAIQGPRSPTYPSGGAGAFAPMGVGWYRKRLQTPACTGRLLVQFDGIMANGDVWLNGHLLGHRPNGYVSQQYDLTPLLRPGPGANNVLAVRADNSAQPSSRFYQGAGLYRHVRLVQEGNLSLETWGTYITTSSITAGSARVNLKAELRNDDRKDRTGALRVTLLDGSGHAVSSASSPSAATIRTGEIKPLALSLTLVNPHVWNLDDPYLYRARVEVIRNKVVVDTQEVPFGVREAHFDAATGFWLNGRNLKIKGVALHSDGGAFGMAVPLSIWEHRLRAMQRMGANAVRTAHNPVAPEFLDLCDRLGMLVLDEFFDVWTVGKNPFDYHLYFPKWYLADTRDTVRRDRNHPAIMAWSAGNEIHDTPFPGLAKPILAALLAEYHNDDPGRPVTQALFRPNVSHDYEDGLADMLDVVGQNYRPAELLAAHASKPARKILGTENIHDRATWLAVRDNASYSGMFLWSGTDYLGESRQWPLFADVSGMNDRTDFPRTDSLERESWWADRPVVHLVRRTAPVQKAPSDPGYELDQYRPKPTAFPDWSPADRSPHAEQVEVYSNCPNVELQLNNRSLGTKPAPADASPRTWQVPFIPGALRAQCLEHRDVAETLTSAGAPAALRLTAESPCMGMDFDHVAEVRATVVDAHNIPIPGAEVTITFTTDGTAQIDASDDADPVYKAPFQSRQRTTYDGRAVVFVRATGSAPSLLLANTPGYPLAQLTLPSPCPAP